MLRDGGEDMDGEAVRGRHVHRDEIHAALHQVRNEGDIARQAVEAGNHQHGAALAALGQRRVKLRAIAVPAPAFNLGERGGELAAAGDVAGDHLALRLQTEAACTLPIGGDPVIRHVIGHAPGRCIFCKCEFGRIHPRGVFVERGAVRA